VYFLTFADQLENQQVERCIFTCIYGRGETMADREGTLGFRPQRENAYNKFLPRHEGLDKECGCVSSWAPTMVALLQNADPVTLSGSSLISIILLDPSLFQGLGTVYCIFYKPKV
jgi:hypothetical protein